MLANMPDGRDKMSIEWAINFYTKALKYADRLDITKEEQEQIKKDLEYLKMLDQQSKM